MELKRHLHELLHLLAPDLRRREFHTGERILHGGGERRVTRVKDLQRAAFVATALVHYELRQDFALDALVPERLRIFRGFAADFLDGLLDLELHERAVVLGGLAGFLALVAFFTGAPLDARGGSALDALTTKVVLVGERLRKVNRRHAGRNADRRRQDLEALRGRRGL